MNTTEQALQMKEKEMNTWENAFEVFVEGAEVHGEEVVERAIKIMKDIDKELTEVFLFPDQEKIAPKIKFAVQSPEEAIQNSKESKESKDARSERKRYERHLREVEETGKVTVKEYYRAFNLKGMLEAQGKTAKIKSHFGRLYTVRVVS